MFREVSAYSDCPPVVWGVGYSDAQLRKVSGLKMAIGQIPQRLRKSFDLPALVAIARAKCHVFKLTFSRVRLSRSHRCTRSTRTIRSLGLRCLPRPCRPPSFSLVVAARHDGLAREIWTQFSVTHVATGLGPTIAWKASPTRTPPPICTSTPCLEPRWSKIVGAASD